MRPKAIFDRGACAWRDLERGCNLGARGINPRSRPIDVAAECTKAIYVDAWLQPNPQTECSPK